MALAGAVERRMREFKSQEFAMTEWAFATACWFSELLFAALVNTGDTITERRLSKFSGQNVVGLV